MSDIGEVFQQMSDAAAKDSPTMTTPTQTMLALDSRLCTTCNARKPISDFPLWKNSGKLRFYSKCRKCRNKSARTPERRTARNAYCATIRESEQRRRNERAHARKRSQKYPEKERAKRAVRTALETGILIRPAACSRCGTTPKRFRDGRSGLQAHHSDYNRPLVVEWLCLACHVGEHHEERT